MQQRKRYFLYKLYKKRSGPHADPFWQIYEIYCLLSFSLPFSPHSSAVQTFLVLHKVHRTDARLTLEGKAGADLVSGLVELVGVERKTEAKGGAGVELGVVGEGSDTAVVDLGLRSAPLLISTLDNQVIGKNATGSVRTLAKDRGSSLYLVASSRPTFLPPWRS